MRTKTAQLIKLINSQILTSLPDKSLPQTKKIVMMRIHKKTKATSKMSKIKTILTRAKKLMKMK